MEEKNQVPFSGTLAQELQLKEVIAAHKEQPGCLMPVLQQAQEIYGYLPIEVQAIVAEGLGISLSEVYGVATFYSQFRLNPKGIYRISICLGTACYVKGAAKVLEAVERKLGIQVGECTPDGLFSLESCRCVGACGLAPVMTIDGEVHAKMTPEAALAILEELRRKEAETA